MLCDSSLKQVTMQEHAQCILSMVCVQQLLFVGFTNGVVRVYKVDYDNKFALVASERVHDFGVNAIQGC